MRLPAIVSIPFDQINLYMPVGKPFTDNEVELLFSTTLTCFTILPFISINCKKEAVVDTGCVTTTISFAGLGTIVMTPDVGLV